MSGKFLLGAVTGLDRSFSWGSFDYRSAHDGCVIGDRQTLLSARPDGSVRVGNVLDVSVETDRICNVDTGNFPRLPIRACTVLKGSHSRSPGLATGPGLQAAPLNWKVAA